MTTTLRKEAAQVELAFNDLSSWVPGALLRSVPE